MDLERLVVRLVADDSKYSRTMASVTSQLQKFTDQAAQSQAKFAASFQKSSDAYDRAAAKHAQTLTRLNDARIASENKVTASINNQINRSQRLMEQQKAAAQAAHAQSVSAAQAQNRAEFNRAIAERNRILSANRVGSSMLPAEAARIQKIRDKAWADSVKAVDASDSRFARSIAAADRRRAAEIQKAQDRHANFVGKSTESFAERIRLINERHANSVRRADDRLKSDQGRAIGSMLAAEERLRAAEAKIAHGRAMAGVAGSVLSGNRRAELGQRAAQGISGIGTGLFGTLTSPAALAGMAGFTATFGVLANHVVRSAAKFEQTAIALEVMTGSKEAGSRMMQQLVDLAVETPFRSRELIGGAKQLKGFGFSNQDILPSLQVLGDVSAGTGTSLDRIILAFGQVRSAGRLMGTELRQFVNAGIPMIDFLSKVMQVPSENIKKLVENGAVSYEHVKRAFNLMVSSGGPYFQLMERLSQTTAGRWEALTENLEVFGRNVGLSFFRGFGMAKLLDDFSKMTRELSSGTEWLDQWFMKLRRIFDIGRAVAEVVGAWAMRGSGGFINDIMNATTWESFEQTAVTIAKVLLTAFQDMVKETKKIAAVFLEDVIVPIVQLTSWIGKLLGKSSEDEKKIWKQVYDPAKDDRNSILKFLFPGPGQSPFTAFGSGDSETEKFLRSQVAKLKSDSESANFSNDLDRRLAEMQRRRVASAWAADPRMSPFNPNRFVPKGAAQIPESFMPEFFLKDRSKFPGSVVGGANNDFQKSIRQIDEARRFLFKKEVGIGGLGGGMGIGGTQWAFQNMANAEFLEAFEKLEKSVNINSKQQNAGAAALKGSQEAIAIIARSEGMGKEDVGARVERVMNAVKEEMKRDADNSQQMKDALNKWLEKNPGVISREP